MVSPSKQVMPRGGGAASKNESEDLPSKDYRVKGPGPRLLLLYRKATSSRPGPWDKVRNAGVQHQVLTRHIIMFSGNAVSFWACVRASSVMLQEDLLDVMYWLRQIIAVLAGVAWGFVPLTGLYAFVGCAL